MYQSIPSLTIPPTANPQGSFLKGRIPHPRHKESAKNRPLGQKGRAKTHPRGNYFKNPAKNTEIMTKTVMKC